MKKITFDNEHLEKIKERIARIMVYRISNYKHDSDAGGQYTTYEAIKQLLDCELY